jgi:hypothetical protein
MLAERIVKISGMVSIREGGDLRGYNGTNNIVHRSTLIPEWSQFICGKDCERTSMSWGQGESLCAGTNIREVDVAFTIWRWGHGVIVWIWEWRAEQCTEGAATGQGVMSVSLLTFLVTQEAEGGAVALAATMFGHIRTTECVFGSWVRTAAVWANNEGGGSVTALHRMPQMEAALALGKGRAVFEGAYCNEGTEHGN